MALNTSASATGMWNGIPESVRMSATVSESSSVHSDRLRSLAHDLSQLGLDAHTYTDTCLPEPSSTAADDTPLQSGVFFADGQRRVDYVLVYYCKKRKSPRLSLASNSSLPPNTAPSPTSSRRSTMAEMGAGNEAMLEAEPGDTSESEKALIRDEFEARLLEEGLEIERDKELRTVRFIRLHAPWAVLSREAELQKIYIPTKKRYEVKERKGVARLLSSLWEKLNRPFQPGVPEMNPKTTLTHPFSRDKLHLFEIKSKERLFDNATRGRIVIEILRRTACTQTCQAMGITSLLAKGIYDSAFPLHDGDFDRSDDKDQRNDRQLLHEEWANYGAFYKYQPVDLIRRYFGEKIGLYFAWLGVYTQLLIPASVMGTLVFLYGCLTLDTNVPSLEMCDERQNFTMCPLCDRVCDYWYLSSVCSTARASHLFDNHATVFFAIFMSLWAAVFLEHWKRIQRCLQHRWDVSGIEDEEIPTACRGLSTGIATTIPQEDLRPAYEDCLLQKRQRKSLKKKKDPEGGTGEAGKEKLLSAHGTQALPIIESLTWRDRLPGYFINVSSILLMIGVTFSAVTGVILYRIIVFAVMSMNPDHEAKAQVRVFVTTTAVTINLLVVLVLDEIYGAIAAWITELEIPKTEAAFEDHLTMKAFLLKSMNAFAPVFYVAFFKGRYAGRPGDYVYVFQDYRMEECAPGGCLIEVCIQLGIIMLGKQLIQNNVFEIAIPKLKKMYREYKEEKHDEEEDEEPREPQRWDLDHSLDPFEGLGPEYMEMVIQYGFVTLFVASFPLAPVLALLNNIIEIRLDAAKFVEEIRRPDAIRAKEIGIWFNILSGISKFAVITNAFVISFTSEFIPRLVYQYLYSDSGSMHGFIDHTLAYFNTSNFKPGSAPEDTQFDRNLRICRYKDYRDPPWSPESYQLSKQYWSVLAARLAFVIFFQNLAMFLSMLVAWLIPDVPQSLKEQVKREKVLLLELLLTDEMNRQKATPRRPTCIDIIIKSPDEAETNLDEAEPNPDEHDSNPEDQDFIPGQDDSPVPGRSAETRVQTLPAKLHELEGPGSPDRDPEEPDPPASQEPPSGSGSGEYPLAECPSRAPEESDMSVSESTNQCPSLSSPAATDPASWYREFVLPPNPSSSSKAKARCKTLPPRPRGHGAGENAAHASQSTNFTLLSQQVPPSLSGLRGTPHPPSQSELAPNTLRGASRPPSQSDLTLRGAPRPPSDSDLTLKGPPRPPSQSDLTLKGPPRPPSDSDLTLKCPPRPPSDSDLALKGPPCPPSQSDLTLKGPRPPSDSDLTLKGPSRPPSESDLTLTGPPRPPSDSDLTLKGPPHPPSDSDLTLKGPPHHPSQSDLTLKGPPRPPSDSNLTLKGPPRPPSPSDLTLKSPPRPPSDSDLTLKGPPRPPSDSDLTLKGPPRPPSHGDLTLTGPPRPPSPSDLTLKSPPRPPSDSDLTLKGPPRPPSDSDLTLKGPPRPPSDSDLTLTGPPRPPSHSDLTLTGPPRPPSDSNLTQNMLRGVPGPPSQSDLTLRGVPRPPSQSDLTLRGVPRPPSQSDLTLRGIPRPPSQSDLNLRGVPRASSQSDLTLRGVPRPPSQSDLTLRGVPCPPSQSDLTLRGVPRPPSQSDLTLRAPPRPPSDSELVLFALQAPPRRGTKAKALTKAKAKTLPPRQRVPEPCLRPAQGSQSISSDLSQQVPPSPSELHRNTPV